MVLFTGVCYVHGFFFALLIISKDFKMEKYLFNAVDVLNIMPFPPYQDPGLLVSL